MAKSAARKVEKSSEAYRSIGEAADELGLQTHVLRYWEGKFEKFVKPLKRRDGRRMFRAEDMQALRAIQALVHERGMTLKGAEKLLSEQGVSSVIAGEARIAAPVSSGDVRSAKEELVAPSPARALQENVREAFAPSMPASMTEAREAAPASQARLETILADLTSLKERLDAARLASAAA